MSPRPHPNGRFDDLFGWCLAIPPEAAGAALGRWVIPASRSVTAYSNLIVNDDRIAAEQDVTGAITEVTDSRQQERLADIVHVLNVAATTPVDPQSAVLVCAGADLVKREGEG